MKLYNKILTVIITGIVMSGGPLRAERRFYMPMDVKNGQITESVSGANFDVEGAAVVESAPGAKGDALRLDGYSNYISANVAVGDLSTFTFSLWCAMETWPIIEHDVQNETDMTCIAGNYDSTAKRGFGFFVSRTGRFSFKFYSGGWPGEIVAPAALPLYQWNNLVVVCDGSKAKLYNNGELLGSANCKKVNLNGEFIVGKSARDRKMGPFNLSTINGLIDEVEIHDQAITIETISSWTADNEPRLSTVSDEKYADDIMRPRFHGMPSRGWTNETHGLIHHNGRYHLFFQKNANGPYMSRLQWGHLVSDNLYEWEEMPIALGSDKWYDLKGCWSGCVAVDDVVTGGEPNIIYTGVDYARAMIGQASPADENLLGWNKKANPIINGKPSGLSDDFRDPYFFRNGGDAYIIVGTSKDGRGACTLHKYNQSNGSWSNDGKIFFSANSVVGLGSFWEMPSVTTIDGKQLFCVTPLGISTGVKAVYWTGSINADGSFNPSGEALSVELPGFARDGYGLLSPSVMQVGGKTIAIGIVPDKLPSIENYNSGWAHTYSLPREWSLDQDGRLIQKPYSGLEAMRDGSAKVAIDRAVSGVESIGRMNGRQAEVVGEFTVGDADFGFTFFGKGDSGLKLFYSPSSGRLTVDMRSVDRVRNDENSFDGLYETVLPEAIAKGSVMKIHVFVDHSIMDIFINDKWASSIRVFPTDVEADGIDVFSNGGNTPVKVSAWALKNFMSGIDDIWMDGNAPDASEYVDVYNMSGVLLRKGVCRLSATEGLDSGLYIVGDRKVLIR